VNLWNSRLKANEVFKKLKNSLEKYLYSGRQAFTFFIAPDRRKSLTRDNLDERFEVFTAVKIRVDVPWVVTPCSDVVVGCQRYRLHDTNTTWCHNPEDIELNVVILFCTPQIDVRFLLVWGVL